MNRIFNWVFGSFFRTLGRVLVYFLIGILLSYLLKNIDLSKINFWQILDVHAESINIRQTADGYVLINDSSNEYLTYIINPNANANLRVKIGTALSQSDIYSYMFMDVCSTRDIDAVRTSSPGQSCTNSCWSNQVYTEKTDYLCTTNAQNGKIYRITTPIQKWEKDLNDEMAYVNDQITINNKTSDIISTTIYGVYVSNDTNNGTINIDYTNIINDIGNRQITAIDASTSAINNVAEEARENTQDIIDNQNSNTQSQIDSQKVCQQIDKNNIEIDNKFLKSNGVEGVDSNFGITGYINIFNSTVKITEIFNSNYNVYNVCYYNVNKTLISCQNLANLENLTIPENVYYMRSSIIKNQNRPTYEICKNGNQAIGDSLSDMNSSINNSDSSQATNDASNFFSNFTTDNHGLTGIITAPLNAINSLTNAQCTPLVLPLPFVNENLTLPCMRGIYEEYFGSFMILYDVITLGIASYWVMVRIFGLVKDFKNPEHDEIEVLDL